MPEVDEFGIPIRTKKQPQEVDEFGIPIKKNDGGNNGTISYAPVTSQSLNGTKSGIALFDEPITIDANIGDFNKNFEAATGYKEFNLSEPIKTGGLRDLISDRDEKFEEKKFKTYQKEKIKIDTAGDKIYKGIIKPNELSELQQNQFSKNIANNIVREYVPEAIDVESSDTLNIASKRIAEKNRINSVVIEDEAIKKLDEVISNDFQNLKAAKVTLGIGEGTSSLEETDLSVGDLNNNDVISTAISQLKKANYLTDGKGNPVTGKKEQLLSALQERISFNIANQGISKTLEPLNEKIEQSVLSKVILDERTGTTDKLTSDPIKVNQFKYGLSVAEKLDPILFKNVTNVIKSGKEIPDTDYNAIALIGQNVDNRARFRGAATDPSLIDTETNFEYGTFGQKKAMAAGQIGEVLKDKGIKNVSFFTEKQIREAAKEIGVPKEIENALVFDEALKGYDAIPKSGWLEDIISGIQQPFEGINSTLNSWTETPVDTYIRSKKLQTSSKQLVPDEQGNYSDILPSEKGFTTDMFRGLGQFIPQVLLTKGVGAGLRAGSTLAIPMAAKTAKNVADYGGTFVSTFLQSYGTAYEEHLIKTGDTGKAALMGTIDGISASAFELILPDIKIAESAMKGLKSGLANDLVGLIDKGGDPAKLLKEARPFVQKFVLNAANISKQEVAEEVGTQAVDFITESIFDPESAKERNLSKELWDVTKSTFAAMLVPAIIGGGGTSLQKDFTTRTLHSAAINIDSYKESLKKSLDNNYISQDQHDKAIQLLQTHKNSFNQVPEFNANGEKLGITESLQFALEETKRKIYKNKAAESDGAVKKMWEDKQAASEEIQSKILNIKLDTKLSEPIEGVNEQGIPIGENVPDATDGNVTEKIGDKVIETDKAIMQGYFGDEIKINDETVKLPKEGFVVSDVNLKEGIEKNKGSGQEIYIKALNEYGTIYSTMPVSGDALNAQNALVKKGIATVRNENIGGNDFRVIEKVEGEIKQDSSITVIQPSENKPPNIIEPYKSPITVIQPEDNKPPNIVENEPSEVIPPITTEPPIEPPVINNTGNGIYTEEPAFTLKKSELLKVRSELGLENFEGETVTNLEAIKKSADTIQDWRDKGTYGIEVNKIIDDANNGKISDEGQNILAQHITDLKLKKNSIVDRYSPEYDATLKELNKAVDAGDVLRSAAGRTLGRQLAVRPKVIESITDVELDMMSDYKVDELTPEQKQEAGTRFNDIKAKLDAQIKISADAQIEIDRLKAENEILKAKKSSTGKKKSTDYKAERQQIITSIKDKWNKAGQSNQVYSTIVPLPINKIKQLAAISPDVARLIKSYIDQSAANTLEQVRLLLKKDIEDAGVEISDEEIRGLIAGNFNERKQTKNQINTQVADLRKEEKLLLKLDALERGEIPKKPKAKVERNQRLKELKDQIDEVQKKMGVGKYSQASKIESSIKSVIKNIKELEEKIDNNDLEFEKKESPTSKELEDYRLQQKELRDQLDEKRKETKIGKYSDESKLDAAEKAALKSIDNLEEKIKNNDLEFDKVDRPTSDQLTQYREKQKALRKELDNERKAAKVGRYSDESKLDNSAKTRIANNKKQQAEFERKLQENDFSEDTIKQTIFDVNLLKKNNPKLYEQYLQSLADKESALFDYEVKRMEDKMKNRNFWEKASGIGGTVLETAKGTVAMFDQSVVLVQALIFSGGHPIKATKFALEAIRNFGDKGRFERQMAELHISPEWDIIKESGLAVYEPRSLSTELRNELHGGDKNLWNKDVSVGGRNLSVGQAFERATTTYLNDARLYLFRNQIENLAQQRKTFESHPEEYKEAARVTNEFTGHGKVQKNLEFAMPVINKFIWSPKMFASTLNVLGIGDFIRLPMARKGFYGNLSPTTQKFAAKELGRFIAMGLSIMAVARLTGAADELDFDPRSISFGTMTKGKKSINMFGRFGGAVKAIVQAVGGKRVIDGKIDVLGETSADKNSQDIILGSFIRGKMTPAAGMAFDLIFNKQKQFYTKEDLDAVNIAKGMLVPMAAKEIGNDFKRDGVIAGIAETIYKVYGGSIRDERDWLEQRKRNAKVSNQQKYGQ